MHVSIVSAWSCRFAKMISVFLHDISILKLYPVLYWSTLPLCKISTYSTNLGQRCIFLASVLKHLYHQQLSPLLKAQTHINTRADAALFLLPPRPSVFISHPLSCQLLKFSNQFPPCDNSCPAILSNALKTIAVMKRSWNWICFYFAFLPMLEQFKVISHLCFGLCSSQGFEVGGCLILLDINQDSAIVERQ